MRRLWVLLALSLLPAATALSGSFAMVGAGPAAYWPTVSDDVTANHQIRTFAVAGFSGGYYAFNEQPAPAAFTHFGAHGPVYPLLYGSLLAPFGAPMAGPLWLHHLLISAATFSAFLLARLRAGQAAASALVIATLWPGAVMLSTSMQEGLHFAVGILAAGLATAESTNGTVKSGFLVAISLLRPTWAAIHISLAPTPRGFRGLLLRLVGTAFLMASAFAAFSYLAAPSPSGLLASTLQGIGGVRGPGEFLTLLSGWGARLARNVGYVLTPSDWQPLEGHLFLLCAAAALIALLRRSDRRALSAFLGLSVVAASVFLLYDAHSYRAFRVLTGPLAFALLAGLWVQPSRALTAGLLALNMGFAFDYAEFMRANRLPMFSDDLSALRRLSDELASRLVALPAADPWCKTVLADHPEISSELAAVPPGFGISVVFGEELGARERSSGYFWVSGTRPRPDGQAAIPGESGPLRINPQSRCR